MKTNINDDEVPGIEMAAMMDCVFLLLIFFLVAATIRKKHNELPIELPVANNTEKVTPGDDTLVISLYKRGNKVEYAVATIGEQLKSTGGAREVVTFQELLQRLRKAAQENARRAVRIDADVAVPYGVVSQVVDHLELYQLRRIGLRARD